MQFRAEFTPKPFPVKMQHTDKLLLVGSCFTEQIGKKLSAHKWKVLENPNGILFNPISIAKAVMGYAHAKIYNENDLFFHNELWASRDHHTRFSNPDEEIALRNINIEQEAAGDFIKKADWILITLGSAFVYEWKDYDDDKLYGNVAANCHKIPTDQFYKRLTSSEEIVALLANMQSMVKAINPKAKFIYTVSPVRHLREGFIENNRSKAVLIQSVHELTNNVDVFYFPAYELVIDDLRDYRFFAEDLAHPNYAATNYVWEKFISTMLDENTQKLLKQINEINTALNHKPFNANSNAHQKFVADTNSKIEKLISEFTYLKF